MICERAINAPCLILEGVKYTYKDDMIEVFCGCVRCGKQWRKTILLSEMTEIEERCDIMVGASP